MKYKKLLAQSLFWRVSGIVTSFILTLSIARIFGPDLSAELNLLIAGSALIILIVNLNIDSAIIYFLAGNRFPLIPLINLVAAWCLIAMTVIFFFSYNINWTDLGHYSGKRLAIALFFYISGLQVTNFSIAFFYGKQNFTSPGFFISLFNCIQAGVLIFLYLENENSSLLNTYLPVFFGAPFLQGFCLAVYFRIKYVRNYSLSFMPKEDVKKVFKMASVFFLANLLLFLMYRIDYWMLMKFDHSEKKLELLGNYIQASKLGQSYLLFSSAIGSAIFAGISASQQKEPIEALCRTIRLLLATGFFSYIIFLLIGRPGISFFYGSSFNHIYLCSLLIIPGIVSLMTVSVTANYLSGKGFMKYNLMGVILGLLIILAGNYFFIPYQGIYASAVVSSIGYISYSAYMLIIFCNKTNCKWQFLVIIRREDILFVKRLFNRGTS